MEPQNVGKAGGNLREGEVGGNVGGLNAAELHTDTLITVNSCRMNAQSYMWEMEKTSSVCVCVCPSCPATLKSPRILAVGRNWRRNALMFPLRNWTGSIRAIQHIPNLLSHLLPISEC